MPTPRLSPPPPCTSLDDWQHRYSISPAALAALHRLLASNDAAPEPEPNQPTGSEARVTSIVRLEAAAADVWLTRNNVGALRDKSGRFVRFGLCNESKQQNTVIKSHDLIGFRRRVIVTSDVGSVIAQFASRECKHEGWKPSPNDAHETAQRAFRDFINSNGGDAAFASGPGSFNY